MAEVSKKGNIEERSVPVNTGWRQRSVVVVVILIVVVVVVVVAMLLWLE